MMNQIQRIQLQIWLVAINIFNEQLQTDDKEWSSTLDEFQHPVQNVTKYYKVA
jgi:hypothetical protein